MGGPLAARSSPEHIIRSSTVPRTRPRASQILCSHALIGCKCLTQRLGDLLRIRAILVNFVEHTRQHILWINFRHVNRAEFPLSDWKSAAQLHGKVLYRAPVRGKE